MNLSVCVFSYNRGSYVENCLSSVEVCAADAATVVYDDNSTDKVTTDYLSTLSCPVVNSSDDKQGRHDGLYANMQRALSCCHSKYILFLQDDTQLVRVVDSADIKLMDRFFEVCPEAAFVNPTFLKGHRRKSISRQVAYQPMLGGYFHSINEQLKSCPVSMYYCDVVLAHVERLKAARWQFKLSETASVEQTRKHFSKILQLANPFVMHVLEVPIFRGKQITYGSRLANKLTGSYVKFFNT